MRKYHEKILYLRGLYYSESNKLMDNLLNKILVLTLWLPNLHLSKNKQNSIVAGSI